MDSEFLDDYRLLGIRPDAGWKELRTAYREQIRAWHPDRFEDGAHGHRREEAEDRSKAINQAYRKLAAYYRRHGCLPLRAAPPARTDPQTVSADGGIRANTSSETVEHVFFERLRAALRRPRSFWTMAGTLLLASYFALILLQAPPSDDHGADAKTTSPLGTIRNPGSSDDDRYFTFGSKIGDVYAVQGIPTRTETNVWHYHTSKVYFEDGVVVRWEATSEHPLKARGDIDPLSAQGAAFTYGSSKAEVRAIQGAPTNEAENAWDYGVSRVYFEHGRVVGWSESPVNPLRARP